jgi:hypothetical protein
MTQQEILNKAFDKLLDSKGMPKDNLFNKTIKEAFYAGMDYALSKPCSGCGETMVPTCAWCGNDWFSLDEIKAIRGEDEKAKTN